MNTVLLIAPVASTREAWCLAARARGLTCRHAEAILTALDQIADPDLAGIVFEAGSEDDLIELAALSTVRPLPPVVIVSGPTATPVTTRFTAGTIVDPAATSGAVVDRLACLVRGRPLTSPTHLPVRLSRSTDAQWTVRLSAKPLFGDDDFEGATQPGFEIARLA